MNMKALAFGSIALVALTAGGPARAADMAVKAPPVAAVAPFNWSRCYVGVHAGYGWGRNTNSFGNAIASGPTEAFEFFPAEFGPFNHDTKGHLAGVQAGCNWQFAPQWLVGVEGEFKKSWIKGGFTAPEDFTPPGDPGQFSRFESRNRWDGDLALRLGFVTAGGTWLLYAKAGAAVGDFRYTETHDDFPTTHACPGLAFSGGQFINGQCSVTVSDTRVGWLVGLGFETVLPWLPLNHWTLKGEWDYIDYGTNNIAYPSAAAAIQSFPVKDTKHLVKVGLNFYFP
jgi:outer membrane immunogenic protein